MSHLSIPAILALHDSDLSTGMSLQVLMASPRPDDARATIGLSRDT